MHLNVRGKTGNGTATGRQKGHLSFMPSHSLCILPCCSEIELSSTLPAVCREQIESRRQTACSEVPSYHGLQPSTDCSSGKDDLFWKILSPHQDGECSPGTAQGDFVLFCFSGSYLRMLRAYFYLCAQGPLLAVLRDPVECQGSNSGLLSAKQMPFSCGAISLWPLRGT